MRQFLFGFLGFYAAAAGMVGGMVGVWWVTGMGAEPLRLSPFFALGMMSAAFVTAAAIIVVGEWVVRP